LEGSGRAPGYFTVAIFRDLWGFWAQISLSEVSIVNKILALTTLLCSVVLHSQNATVIMTASHLGGQNPVNGTIYFQPVLNGKPVSYRLAGGGQSTTLPIAAPVVNGAFTVALPDMSLSSPTVCYAVTVLAQGISILGPGYSCLQPHDLSTGIDDYCQNGVCNFDAFLPSLPVPSVEYPNLVIQVQSSWNDAVYTASLMGNPLTPLVFSDAPVLTFDTAGQSLAALKIALNSGISARTINVTNLAVGARFLIHIIPTPTVTQSVTLGSGCVWQPAPNSGLETLPVLTLPAGNGENLIVAAIFDGTNCNVIAIQP
jgi:hypothetical protein